MKKVMLISNTDQLLLNDLQSAINNEQGWFADIATDVETAIEKFHQQDFDAVVLTPGLAGEQQNKLHRIFLFQNPNLSIIDYEGSDSEKLYGIIKNEFDKKSKVRKASFSFVDDVLKNAGIPISYN